MSVWRFLSQLLNLPFRVGGSVRPSLRSRRPFPVRVVRVQDGDSLIAAPAGSTDRKDEFRVRLYAIDAPESDQEYGSEAREYLSRLTRGQNDLMLEPVDTDRYGRLVGVLYFRRVGRGDSVNRLMVQQGLSRWYSQYGGHGLGLDGAERDARRRRLGLWSSGDQVAPWDHRRSQRERAERARLAKLLLMATLVSAVVVVAIYSLRHLL